MVGKIDIKPNTIQRFFHRFLMLRPVSAILAPILHHIDALTMRVSRGHWTATNLVGLPVIQLTTVGAKSNLPRTVPLVGLMDNEKIALIGTNFGKPYHPGWVHNLRANPECYVSFNGKLQTYNARFTASQEYENYWQMALSYYAGYEEYRNKAGGREIPVILLEPKA